MFSPMNLSFIIPDQKCSKGIYPSTCSLLGVSNKNRLSFSIPGKVEYNTQNIGEKSKTSNISTEFQLFVGMMAYLLLLYQLGSRKMFSFPLG